MKVVIYGNLCGASDSPDPETSQTSPDSPEILDTIPYYNSYVKVAIFGNLCGSALQVPDSLDPWTPQTPPDSLEILDTTPYYNSYVKVVIFGNLRGKALQAPDSPNPQTPQDPPDLPTPPRPPQPKPGPGQQEQGVVKLFIIHRAMYPGNGFGDYEHSWNLFDTKVKVFFIPDTPSFSNGASGLGD